MIFKTPAMRLTLALVLLTVNLLFLANLLGFVPDETTSALKLRKTLSESLALQFTAAAEKGEYQTIQSTLRAVVERNDDIRSAAIRTQDGELIALAGEHLAHWGTLPDGKSTPTHVLVPVFKNNKNWATVEIRFAPLWTEKVASGLAKSFVGLVVFAALSSFLCFYLIIKRTLRALDPTVVIPKRVQKAFDVLKEGVLILDDKEQIVLANQSFAKLFDKAPEELIGLKGSELGWLNCQDPKQVSQLPWFKVLQEGHEQKDTSLSRINRFGRKIKLAASVAMINDDAGKCRGTLVTFDDITQLEEKNLELNDLVEKLQLTQDEIRAKSKELEFLANHDPLTLCLNRRCLIRNFKDLFAKAKASQTYLSCLMVDIDVFKTVNDRYGHATGDQVIKAVAEVLTSSTRNTDLVGRYGGEEFCVILPGLNLEMAFQIAERIRLAIEKNPCGGVKVTVSQGVASLESNVSDPDDLVNQADKALYAAKQSGRNRVVTWGRDIEPVLKPNLGEKIPVLTLPTGTSGTGDPLQDHLRNRIQELEGLVAKRALEIEHYAMYDFRTGLPKRSLFADRLSAEITRSKRGDYLVAVLSMRIDTIKRIQETLGEKAAEQLMKDCARRMNDLLRLNIDTVALMENAEGNPSVSLIDQAEFGVLLTHIKQVDHVTWVLKRLMDTLEKPFQINGEEIFIAPYIGVSLFPHDGQSVEELYSSAVNACSYAQRNEEKDHYLFSSRNLNEMAANQLQIENLLHEAIQNDELELHFQPKIEAATGLITGFEALLRWNSARLGPVAPDQFIPIAEQSGQIRRLGDWVLYNACRQRRIWLDKGVEVGSIAINLSGTQLGQKNLPGRIQEILNEFSLDTHLLEIELTESSLVNIHEKASVILEQMKKMGLRVALDDFGTGYSSLSYLKNLQLSGIKIDKSFVADIHKDENSEKLISSIVSIAHALGLEVIAEGVEERHQADYLIALGCEYLQGHFFCPPVPPGEVERILKKSPLALMSFPGKLTKGGN
ncbi:MAG: EAL domain-containing protein [Deltaproteobacteria bacterium]|nr:EAL domain-containing protein [Deltaproteobacteria bacterium]